MKRFFLILIFILFAFSNSFKAQSLPRKANSVFLELGGNGVLYSLNYDRLLNKDFGLKAGVMFMAASEGSSAAAAYAVPLTFNYFFGDYSSRLELGAGASFIAAAVGSEGSSFNGSGTAVSFNIGYRYQPMDGGFLFRATFSPFYINSNFIPWGGLSFGYSF